MSSPATTVRFSEGLAQSGLLPSAMLEQYRQPTGADDPTILAAQLVRDGLLTAFQARLLLAGRHAGFFLTDKYKVLDLIGTGGMGQVFLCEHLLLQRLVAVKVLQRAAGESARGGLSASVERFLREARAVAALDHANIVRVYDMERAGGVPFLVMEYVDGSS